MKKQTLTDSAILNLKKWGDVFRSSAGAYASAHPFPFACFDNFLNPATAKDALLAFPKVEDEGWIHYLHVNEKKHGLNKIDRIPEPLRKVIEFLNSQEFVSQLSKLTGIPDLIPDPELEGGGLHQTRKGGFLNVHADFTVHPHKRRWRRRVNLLIYFNPEWKEEYGGHLELWKRDMSECAARILPIYNRVAIFNTDKTSFHGLPEPIDCPEGMTRKSVALYYFTEESTNPEKHATNYRARPEDGWKRYLIYLDKKLIQMYTGLKGMLGINDDIVSRILNIFGKRRK